jgi:hypothetical protein
MVVMAAMRVATILKFQIMFSNIIYCFPIAMMSAVFVVAVVTGEVVASGLVWACNYVDTYIF